jgi:photosystem II stability/assembly factor-like uncharacterized protein
MFKQKSSGIFLFTLITLLSLSGQRAFAQRPDHAAPRFDAWHILGPGGGGAMFYPAISPRNPNLVLVACDMTGAYISNDGGNSWRLFDLRRPVTFFTFDPADPKVIYAGAGVLWRSTDGGKTWALIFPSSALVKGLIMPDDHASPIVETSERPSEIQVAAFAVDPADSKTLFLAAGRQHKMALYISTDRGTTWQRSADLPGGARQIYVDSRSPRSNRTLYIVGTNSVTVRKSSRWQRYEPPPGVAEFRDVSAGFSPSGKLIIYAVAQTKRQGENMFGGFLVSPDSGATWKQATEGFLAGTGASGLPLFDDGSLPEFRAVAASCDHPDVAYVSYSRLRLHVPAVRPSIMFHGVAKTTDRGRTWRLVWREANTPAANIHEAWITERFGPGWGENPLSLGVAPSNPDICYATDYGRTLRTTDGGTNWYAVYSKRMSDGTYASTGLDVTTNYGVFFDPFDAKRVFIAYTDIGLFRSEDGGESWTSATKGVPSDWVNTTYWITFDPAVKGRVWGAMSFTHDLPRPKMWRRASPSTYKGGVSISEDGGRTWRPSSQGLPQMAATHILLDLTSPVEKRVLYVTGFGRGVFKSADGGRSWTLKNNGLPGPEPFAWRLAEDKNGVLYLVVARRSEDGSFGDKNDGALYRSGDGAEHWERVALPEGVNGPNGIAIDPANPLRLYLAVWGRSTPKGAAQGGIYISDDGGGSWRQVFARDQHVYDITFDPRNARTLYACGFESSAWRSTGRGETWQRIKGFNFKWGHRVIADPQDPSMIYITTFGGGVWHGPAAGDAQAVEDIVTPVLAYSK